MTPVIRTAVPEDAEAIFGRCVSLPWVGYTAEVEGVIVGIGGVAWKSTGPEAFLGCRPRYMPSAIRATKLARELMQRLVETGQATEIFAVPDEQYPRAKRWLRAIGFRPHDGERWLWQQSSRV